MQASIGTSRLELVTGDITHQATDAIVNAANSRLAGGGGVDGAIHRRGGPGIMEETRQRYPQGCRTGEAVVTGAGKLAAQYVIHAVGPIWKGGHSGEESALTSAYWRGLEIAGSRQCASIAFPSLSTGAYAYPLPPAAHVALHTVATYLRLNTQPELVRFVLFDDQTYTAYRDALTALLSEKHCG